MLSFVFEARRYVSISAVTGASSGPISGTVRRVANETKFGDGRRAITEGMIDF